MENDSAAPVKRGPRGGMYRKAHWWVLSLFVVIFAGFFKTYFMRLSATDLPHHLHAIIAIGWMVLLVLQAYFITKGKAAWHRALAKLSFVIMPLLVVTGLVVVYAMLTAAPLKLGAASTLFAFADFDSLLYLIILFTMGIVYRYDVRQHQRFMVATVFVLFPPGLARIFLIDFPLSWTVSFALTAIYLTSLAIVVVLLIRDWLDEKTVYFAYGFSFVYFLIAAFAAPFLRDYKPWLQFCLWFTGQLH